MPSRAVTVKIPETLARRLDAAAAERGLSQSELLRRAIDDYLGRGPSAEGTFGALASDLCGMAEGPRDLSTHPRHLKGYGK